MPYKTTVKINVPIRGEHDQLLDIEGREMDEKKYGKKQVQAFEDVFFYLLHWGLTCDILEDKGVKHPVTWTIGICQKRDEPGEGRIMMFTPDQLIVVGKELV